MPAPKVILDLVARYSDNEDAYRRDYSETETRREFLDPFFKALGWDIDNTAGHAEAYKDVVHEDSVKVGFSMKAPDYSFRVGGVRKFFLEAKKPAVNIKEDQDPAFQLRRYAWSAKLPLSILSNFAQFVVFDCRIRPKQNDKAATARTMYFTYKEYADHWDEIVAVFSKDALYKGSFDKYATGKGKKGTAEVDDAFLEEIEHWRDSLAHNIALRNSKLTQPELNFAVQQTIDRIIFLRICEDRGIEPYGRLKGLQNGEHVYGRLKQFFHFADERYNSGLFHFNEEKGRTHPDELTLQLKIDDKVLKDIFGGLYYPESPYEFSVLPAEILGQVYEQFLGKVIRLTTGGHAKVEDKPEVKKAGGVFYTPRYIVDYIVKQTVGKLLEGGTPDKAAKLKILDPACGSGSFLLGTYQYLLDWHRDWYSANDPDKHTRGRPPRLFKGPGGGWRLTTAERKRILLNNIHGVDIDAQAVEVTKLSLLLKVLEEESGESLNKSWEIFHERALPDLDNNVKCGNSLIGPDYFEGRLAFDEDERHRINPFDWETEFTTIIRRKAVKESGGFDVVIGNPPYVRMEEFKQLKDYFRREFACHDERSDLYAYFIERSHHLLNARGRFGMIVSNKFLRANYGKPLRDFLRKNASVEEVVDFAGLPVFQGATVRTIVLITTRARAESASLLYFPPLPDEKFVAVEGGSVSVEKAVSGNGYTLAQTTLDGPVWGFAEPENDALIKKLQEQGLPLVEYAKGQIMRGVVSGLTEAFVIDNDSRRAIVKDTPAAAKVLKPFLNGRDVRRYHVDYKNHWLIYTYHGFPIKNFRAIEQHLRPFKEQLEARATKQEWYELQQPQFRFAPYMDGPKIIFPDIATEPRFALDETGCYGANTTYFIPGKDLFLLGLLNSSVAGFFFRAVCAGLESKGETYLRFFGQYLEGFPVAASANNRSGKGSRGNVVGLVEQMLALKKQFAAVKTSHEKTALERQIETTDIAINQAVYELYGLSGEEIEIIEKSAPAKSDN